MKNFLILLLTMLVALSCSALIACGDGTCEHDFGDWETLTQSTCTVKGEKVKECKKCGEKVNEEIELVAHSFGDWQTEVEPDCMNDGERKRTCTVCGETENESIPATGVHTYNNKGVCLNCNHNISVAIHETTQVSNVKQTKYYYNVNVESENDLTIETVEASEKVDAILSIKIYESDGTTEVVLTKDGNTYKTMALDQGTYYIVIEYALTQVGSNLTLNVYAEFTPPYGI